MFNPRVRISSLFPFQQIPHVFKLESGACSVNKKPFLLGSKDILPHFTSLTSLVSNNIFGQKDIFKKNDFILLSTVKNYVTVSM